MATYFFHNYYQVTPVYRGWLYLYRLVRWCRLHRRRSQTFVHAIVSKHFYFLYYDRLMTLTYRSHDKIFGRFSLWPLNFKFQGQIWNFMYLSKKAPIVTKWQANFSIGLKRDNRVLPWQWPWLWIFKVKDGICYSSTRNGPIAIKRNANVSIKQVASKVCSSFDSGLDLDIGYSMSYFWIAQSDRA